MNKKLEERMVGLAKAAHEYQREAPKQMSWLGHLGQGVGETVKIVTKSVGNFIAKGASAIGRGIASIFGF